MSAVTRSSHATNPLSTCATAATSNTTTMADMERGMGFAAAAAAQAPQIYGVRTVPKAPEPESLEIPEGGKPIERRQRVHEALVANFDTVSVMEPKYKHNNFNDLGQRVPRDETRETNTPEKIIAAMNDYQYGASLPGKVGGILANALTLSGYYWHKRVYVPPAHFGHYVSSGRHMFVKPGHHALLSTSDTWHNRAIPIDDEENLIRTYGSKILIYVPENHVGGAFRVGIEDELAEDGDYVLFPQGHHVLPHEHYREVEVKALHANEVVQLGPLSILYIKEGYIGGAYSRSTAQFNILFPGPPYVLNNKEYEDPTIVSCDTGRFELGPITFVTVSTGQLGAALHKESGKTQFLYPGHTYQLHKKDYANIQVKTRSLYFHLISCYFLTVEDGYYACALNKQTGKDEAFGPGNTYQLSNEIYEAPNIAKVDSHVVTCGHHTIITPRDDMLIGAYERATGAFVEFSEPTTIHQKDYHGIEQIEKYSNQLQKFGPYKVVTVKGGVGVFVRNGVLEIKDAGFYKLSADYEYNGVIPVKRFSNQITVTFDSKDGVRMKAAVMVVWEVVDPTQTARYPGAFEQVSEDIADHSRLIMAHYCRNYNRDQILPTKQDVLMQSDSISDVSEQRIAELLEKNEQETQALYEGIKGKFKATLMERLRIANTGTEVVSAEIETFEVLDEEILENLRRITQAIVDTNRQKVEAEKKFKDAQNQARLEQEQSRAQATVAIERAKAEASVQENKEMAAANVRRAKATADAEIERERATVTAQVDRERAQGETEAKRIRAVAANEMRVAEAKAEADAIQAKSKAEHDRMMREHEAMSHMSENEVKLKLAAHQVEMTRAFGNAAWQHPNKMLEMLEHFPSRVHFGLPIRGRDTKGGSAAAEEVVERVNEGMLA